MQNNRTELRIDPKGASRALISLIKVRRVRRCAQHTGARAAQHKTSHTTRHTTRSPSNRCTVHEKPLPGTGLRETSKNVCHGIATQSAVARSQVVWPHTCDMPIREESSSSQEQKGSRGGRVGRVVLELSAITPCRLSVLKYPKDPVSEVWKWPRCGKAGDGLEVGHCASASWAVA
eukprot:2927568-Rhodomonas_salina.1